MSKGQKRSNREAKKPKQPKLERKMANYIAQHTDKPAPISVQREHGPRQR